MTGSYTPLDAPIKGQAIVVLPARGGSKRFPRKNIALLAGRPLLAYPIAAAVRATSIDAVYVSTEDDEIAEVALRCGAKVPFRRPIELAGDQVTADAAVADMLRRLRNEQGLNIDIVVLIQPTSPFVTSAHIDAAVGRLRAEPQLDSVTTMAELDHRHHPYNLSFLQTDGCWEFNFPRERNESLSRQSKPTALKFGNLFAVRTETMLNEGRFGRIKGAVLIDPIYSWDIDYPWELHVAESLLTNGFVSLPHIVHA
jgi:CMP-N-acetylneuraminic acid synthetase